MLGFFFTVFSMCSCCCPQLPRLVSSLKIGTCSWTVMLLFLSKEVAGEKASVWLTLYTGLIPGPKPASLLEPKGMYLYTGWFASFHWQTELSGMQFVFGILSWRVAVGGYTSAVTWALGWGLSFPFKGTAGSPGHSENWVKFSFFKFGSNFLSMKTVLRNQSMGVNCEYWHSWAFKGHKWVCIIGLVYRDMEAFLATWGTLWMFKCAKLSVCHSVGMKFSPCTLGDGGREVLGYLLWKDRWLLFLWVSIWDIPVLSGSGLHCVSLPSTGTESWPQSWQSAREETQAICFCGPGCPCIHLGQCQGHLWGSSCGTAAAG